MKQFKNAVKNLKKRARPLILKLARLILRTPLPEGAFICCLIFGKYLENADFQYPGEVILPIIMFTIISAVMFYIYRLVLRSWFAARLASIILIYTLYSFNYLSPWLRGIGQVLLPKHLETTFTVATMTVFVFGLAAGLLGLVISFAARHIKFIKHLQLHRILLFTLLFIFAIQSYNIAAKLTAIRRQLAYKYPPQSYQKNANATVQRPDIYYFVFEDYANDETLKNIYGYDNSDLANYLTSQGFDYRQDAMANYPFTMQSVSSTLAMQYHTNLGKLFSKDKLGTAFPYRSIFQNPPVAQVLKQNGYQYNQVSSWWDFTRINIKADNQPSSSFRLRLFGQTFYMTDLSRDIINKSILSQWLKKGMTLSSHSLIKYDLDNNPRENFFAQDNAVKALASAEHDKPQFTFAQFLAPHSPYVFDADGSDPDYDGGRNDSGIIEKDKYTREITYVNSQIKDMMGYIRQHSPDAVIIIQSDEGSYPDEFHFELTPDHFYDPSTLPLEKEKQKFGIQASYYMPGVDQATIRSQVNTPVNVFRFILSHYLGYNLGMLPSCQFSAGDKFNVFEFKNETPKLQKNASVACNSL